MSDAMLDRPRPIRKRVKQAPRPGNLCLFCGLRRKMSKEHVIAEWMQSILPQFFPTKHNDYEFARTSPKTYVPLRYWKRDGHPGTRKVRRVCTACNNGWMSALEPILRLLVFGHVQILDAKSRSGKLRFTLNDMAVSGVGA